MLLLTKMIHDATKLRATIEPADRIEVDEDVEGLEDQLASMKLVVSSRCRSGGQVLHRAILAG
jgi:hypothetical protein